jgi:NADPH:quinone reductase-like Zn-dependent oxidoreductase
MKSYHISAPQAQIEDIVVREHDVPRPGRHEVLMRVRATSLN